MGIHIIKMPDIGEGIAEVELVAWHVKPGDAVAEDQVLADVMTDKATVEIPSPVKGVVISLGGAVGEVMAVGSEVIRLDVEGAGNVRAETPPKQAAGVVSPQATVAQPNAPAPAPTAAPAAKPESRQHPSAAAPQRSAATAPAKPAAAEPGMPMTRDPTDRPIASPSVRRKAWDMGIDLQFVQGSGPAGRILHDDLDVYVRFRIQGPTAGSVSSAYVQRLGEEAIPVIGLRRKIAQKMQDAKRRIPHFSYVEEVDVSELEALRARLNAMYGKTRGKLTVLPLLVRAVVLAVRDFPQINARFDDDAGVITRHAPVHLGVAAQTDAGLMVPVIRHAEARDLWATAAEITRLADAARAGKATREELAGSTITISSLGALGGIVTTPVINHPEVAIIGVNRIVERPVIRDGLIVVRKMMNLSSSFDHRVVDGMDAAEFVQAIRALLETPATLFVE